MLSGFVTIEERSILPGCCRFVRASTVALSSTVGRDGMAEGVTIPASFFAGILVGVFEGAVCLAICPVLVDCTRAAGVLSFDDLTEATVGDSKAVSE